MLTNNWREIKKCSENVKKCSGNIRIFLGVSGRDRCRVILALTANIRIAFENKLPHNLGKIGFPITTPQGRIP